MYFPSICSFTQPFRQIFIESVLCAGARGIGWRIRPNPLSHGFYIHPNMKTEEIPHHHVYRKVKQGDVTEHELKATLEEVGERLFEEMTLMLSHEY